MNETGQQAMLLVSAMTGVQNLAELLSHEAGVTVQVARNLRSALATLRRGEFAAVLVDTGSIPSETAELIWQRAGLAATLEMSLADIGAARMIHEVEAAIERRARESRLARLEATNAVHEELRQQLTGVVLQAELMMRERAMPPAIALKVQKLHDLTDELRVRLRNA